MSQAFDGLRDFFASCGQTDQQSGVLTLADLDSLIDTMKEQAGTSQSWLIPVSPTWIRRMRHLEMIGAMYRAYPRPHYKIRKCHMRKLQARWREGRRRIRKIEQAEGIMQ